MIRATVVWSLHRRVRKQADKGQYFPDDLIEDLVQAVYLRVCEESRGATVKGERCHSISRYLSMLAIKVVRDYVDELPEGSGGSILVKAGASNLDRTPATSARSRVRPDEMDRAIEWFSPWHRDRDALILMQRVFDRLTLDEIVTALQSEMRSPRR
ncbi:MAG TPA: hypothetical protein VLM38_05475 [Blastocatellia bacterium]|nr:hypothetical protein [Blastocatellia bacterium]